MVTSATRVTWYPLPVLTTWGGRNGDEVSTPRPDLLQSWAFQLERSLTTQQKIKCAAPAMRLKRQENNQTTTTVEKIGPQCVRVFNAFSANGSYIWDGD